MRNKDFPLVSIGCITYNHEKYIRDCIEGFLMQKTNFPFEIIIHDDASTDKTPEIIKEYAKKYPKLFVPILQEENQYSKGVDPYPTFVFPQVRGKYIAICEGDDYWTDPLKLQKQVDFLKNHSGFMLTVSGFVENKNGKEKTIIKSDDPSYINETEQGFEFDLSSRGWLTKSLTLVFRKNQEIFKQFEKYKYGRDVHLNYHLLKKGKGYYFKESFGVYNIHEGGIFSLKSKRKKIIDHFFLYQELYEENKDEFLRRKYFIILQKVLRLKLYRDEELRNQYNFMQTFKLAWQIQHSGKDKLRIIKSVIQGI